MSWEGFNPRSSHTKDSKKWYFLSPCLTLSIIRYVSRVKWSNPRKGVAPLSTPRCSSYWNGNLRVALDYGRQHYFLLICWSIFLSLYLINLFKINTHVFMRLWLIRILPDLCHIWQQRIRTMYDIKCPLGYCKEKKKRFNFNTMTWSHSQIPILKWWLKLVILKRKTCDEFQLDKFLYIWQFYNDSN